MCPGTSFFNLHVICLVINESSDAIQLNKECLMADIKQIIFNILKVGADAPSVRLNTFVSQCVVAYIADRRGSLSLLVMLKAQRSMLKLYTVSRKFLFDKNIFLTASP